MQRMRGDLPEADEVVMVLVHFPDHCLEREVCLRHAQLLHHSLQLLKVYELVVSCVVSSTTTH